ncbi:MAG: Trm112 family protein [Edaphobacter sp.]
MSAKPLTAEDLRLVVCPVCHQALQLKDDAIQCGGCARRYPIVDGIPVLLADRSLSM